MTSGPIVILNHSTKSGDEILLLLQIGVMKITILVAQQLTWHAGA